MAAEHSPKDKSISLVFQGRTRETAIATKEKPCFCACHDSYEMGSKKADLK
ncbi:MAG: hypothetical protein P8168_04390 [Deltaproteobacteria bacterium]|jgi:hypothetical protein